MSEPGDPITEAEAFDRIERIREDPYMPAVDPRPGTAAELAEQHAAAYNRGSDGPLIRQGDGAVVRPGADYHLEAIVMIGLHGSGLTFTGRVRSARDVVAILREHGLIAPPSGAP